eukprot:CAMPEP_0185516884 /NCGR_PEP_ID=MMETSP1366-20130426/66926_1 /TAXON_ID=38817 /ORGANISM="Gephyrocapsa oceanica, Strain RCC1303" /LENGTH=109 /DNA_ID=CAMNT_0028127809 /DNA_START=212 /DNA_END=538 /DNA_ORIENTATION=+
MTVGLPEAAPLAAPRPYACNPETVARRMSRKTGQPRLGCAAAGWRAHSPKMFSRSSPPCCSAPLYLCLTGKPLVAASAVVVHGNAAERAALSAHGGGRSWVPAPSQIGG